MCQLLECFDHAGEKKLNSDPKVLNFNNSYSGLFVGYVSLMKKIFVVVFTVCFEQNKAITLSLFFMKLH